MGILDLDKLWRNTTKKIRTDKTFMPFNPNFDDTKIVDIVNEVLDAIKSGEVKYEGLAKQVLDLCYCVPIINYLYETINDDFRKIIHASGLTIDEFEQLLLATVNRDYFIIKEASENNVSKYVNKKDAVIDLTTMSSPTIKSPMKSIGEVNTTSMVEGSVDCVILLLNYLKHFGEDIVERQTLCDLDAIQSVYRTYVRSNFIYILKYDFEDIIWNNGYVVCDHQNKTILYDYFSHNDLKLRCTGHRILANRVYDKHLTLRSDNKQRLSKYLKFKRIKSTNVHNGYLKFKLSTGQDSDIVAIMSDFSASLSAYYAYLVDVPFRDIPSLNIEKTLVMLGAISRLLSHIKIDIKDTEVTTICEFYNYPFRISQADLKQYIANTTYFNSKDIGGFLKLLEVNSKFINLWCDPLLKRGDDYLFALLPMTMPVVYNIVDNWLLKGGLSLDDRGRYFEDYIRNEIKDRNPLYKFPCEQIEQKIFVGENNKKEEIDLLISLRDVLIIGEIKCITYSTEVRDFHNANKRLCEGCNQVVRKAEFLKCNHKKLLPVIGSYKHKKIIKVVITNYPLFTGMTHYEVPIIDADTFIYYFKSGTIFKKISGIENTHYFNDIDDCEFLYTNENEFNANVESFLFKPPIVNKVLEHVKIKAIKRSPDSSVPSIFTIHADL